MNTEQCPECGCELAPEIIETQVYMSCTCCGWNRKVTRREFIGLPMDIRRKALAHQASDPEIVRYYDRLDMED